MKRISIFLVTLLIGTQLVLAMENDREFLLLKRTKFSHIRTTGIVLGSIGAGMVIGGFILASDGGWDRAKSKKATQLNSEDVGAAAGVFGMIVGVPLGIAGLVLGGIGSNKVHIYDRMLESTSVGFEVGPSRKGAKLVYAF